MLRRACLGITASLLVCSISLRTFAEEPKAAEDMTIAEIMAEAHKEAKLLRKVVKGEATDGEQERLLALYKSMAAQDPPMGDKDKWKDRNELLVGAAEAAINGEADGTKQLRKASNCMACHKEHKPNKPG